MRPPTSTSTTPLRRYSGKADEDWERVPLDLSVSDKPIEWFFEDDPLAPDLDHSCGELDVPRIPCLLYESTIPFGHLRYPVRMFWFAFSHWIESRYRSRQHRASAILREISEGTTKRCFLVIDDLPWQDRPPLVFGALLLAAAKGQAPRDTLIGKWLDLQSDRGFPEIRRGPTPLNEWEQPFPPIPLSLSKIERRILDGVLNGEISLPDRLPVSLEESPRRIWERAASGQVNESRLMRAALLSLERFELLRHLEADPFGSEHDVGDAFDLIALAPRSLAPLKAMLLEEAERRIEAGELQWFEHQRDVVWRWVEQRAAGSVGREGEKVARSRPVMPEGDSALTGHRRKVGLMRAGSLKFRLGDRQGAMACAKEFGSTPSRELWHLQPVAGSLHARVHEIVGRGREVPDDTWTGCPALASSAMVLPLWIRDGQPRLKELTALFSRAADYPWIFPKLYHVIQWHLALAGDKASLDEIVAICPRFSLGLLRNSNGS